MKDKVYIYEVKTIHDTYLIKADIFSCGINGEGHFLKFYENGYFVSGFSDKTIESWRIKEEVLKDENER